MKINLAGKGLSKMRAFSWKCAHFKENVHIFGKCVKMRTFSTENAKNKFSDIGLASSKGLFFERPNKYTQAKRLFIYSYLQKKLC